MVSPVYKAICTYSRDVILFQIELTIRSVVALLSIKFPLQYTLHSWDHLKRTTDNLKQLMGTKSNQTGTILEGTCWCFFRRQFNKFLQEHISSDHDHNRRWTISQIHYYNLHCYKRHLTRYTQQFIAQQTLVSLIFALQNENKIDSPSLLCCTINTPV